MNSIAPTYLERRELAMAKGNSKMPQRKRTKRSKKSDGQEKPPTRRRRDRNNLVLAFTIPHYCLTQPNQLNDEEEWENPMNVVGNSPGSFSHVDVDKRYEESSLLIATNFGFTPAELPDSVTIEGIEVIVTTSATSSVPSTPVTDCVNQTLMLTKTGSHVPAPGCTNKADDDPLSSGSITKGGDGDLWGATWSPGQLRSTDFGVLFRCENYDDGKGLQGRVHRISVIVYSS